MKTRQCGNGSSEVARGKRIITVALKSGEDPLTAIARWSNNAEKKGIVELQQRRVQKAAEKALESTNGGNLGGLRDIRAKQEQLKFESASLDEKLKLIKKSKPLPFPTDEQLEQTVKDLEAAIARAPESVRRQAAKDMADVDALMKDVEAVIAKSPNAKKHLRVIQGQKATTGTETPAAVMKVQTSLTNTKRIKPKLTRSDFSEQEIEDAADAILAAGGTINPLVIRRTGMQEYEVVGDRAEHLAYYGAARAKEKDIKRAETIQSIIVENDEQEAAVKAQMAIFRPNQAPRSPAASTATAPADMKVKTSLTNTKRIKPKMARSDFSEQEIEDAANAILAAGGTINPLVIRRTGMQEYEVVGDRAEHLAYYGAARAKEKDLKRAEVIQTVIAENSSEEQALRRQMSVFR